VQSGAMAGKNYGRTKEKGLRVQLANSMTAEQSFCSGNPKHESSRCCASGTLLTVASCFWFTR